MPGYHTHNEKYWKSFMGPPQTEKRNLGAVVPRGKALAQFHYSPESTESSAPGYDIQESAWAFRVTRT